MSGLVPQDRRRFSTKLKFEVVMTIPTIGFNLETAECWNLSFTVWDVGGQDKIPCLAPEFEFHRVGRGRLGQDLPSVVPLLPGYEQTDLRYGQQRSRQD